VQPAGHRQIDHTADLALELWAPDERELLLEGARAIVEVLTEGASIEPRAERRIALCAVDREDRLVQWLNEVLYAAVTDGFLFASADLELAGSELAARVLGEEGAGDRVATELKSVTYHDLLLESGADGWRARVVIDV
jgi:SHS2 domain-containing protein